MRKFLIGSISLTIVLLILSIGGLIAIGSQGPFLPGSPFFTLQRTAEESLTIFYLGPAQQAHYYLNLLERRISNLEAVKGTKDEISAIDYLSQSVDQAELAVSAIQEADAGPFKQRLAGLTQRALAILPSLTIAPQEAPEQFAALHSKLTTLQKMVGIPAGDKTVLDQAAAQSTFQPVNNQSTPVGNSPAAPSLTLTPQAVLFPPGSAGAVHAFYPLTGKHAGLECQSCHPNGQYTGTPKQCIDCHQDKVPANHYTATCDTCHVADDWKEINFDHAAIDTSGCASCHAVDKPDIHYEGACSACHSTEAWKPASFDHAAANATNCAACHSKDTPDSHYSGQCSACHSNNAWKPASFNHDAAGATNCTSCHASDKPANHFSGQCAACHSTNRWTPASFNHTAAGATDCSSCHAKDKPSNHFSGQCSACHSTKGWKPASFNHDAANATNCSNCHTKDKPDNHFSGQCSQCHNTSGWKPANFNHSGAGTDCSSCHAGDKPAGHYSGQCSQCHSTNAWKPANFNHPGSDSDCSSCHAGDKPANHYAGQCSQCHNTSAWTPANFNHTFPISHGGANGVCSKCHPSGGSDWTCYNCHNKNETENQHAEKNILNIAGRCLECHPTGKGD